MSLSMFLVQSVLIIKKQRLILALIYMSLLVHLAVHQAPFPGLVAVFGLLISLPPYELHILLSACAAGLRSLSLFSSLKSGSYGLPPRCHHESQSRGLSRGHWLTENSSIRLSVCPPLFQAALLLILLAPYSKSGFLFS